MTESSEAEPVVTRDHRAVALFARSPWVSTPRAWARQWIETGVAAETGDFVRSLDAIAKALATAEHNAKRESADYTAKLEARVVRLCELIDSLHFALGKREPHGTPEMTVACVLDWIRDVKNPVEPLL